MSPPRAGQGGGQLPWQPPTLIGDSAEPELGPRPLSPPTDRLDPPGGQVLALHPAGRADRAAGAAGVGPGAGLGLLRPERPLGLHPDPAEGLLGGARAATHPGPASPCLGEGPLEDSDHAPSSFLCAPQPRAPPYTALHTPKWPNTGQVATSPAREVEAGSWDCHRGSGSGRRGLA